MGKKYYTGLYSDIAYETLRTLHHRLDFSDRKARRTHNYMSIEREPNNEVVIAVKDNVYQYNFNRTAFGCCKSDAELFKWFAWQLKNIARRGRCTPDWDRTSTKTNDVFELLTFGEIYFLYDFLNSRGKTISRRYSKELCDKIVGKQLDPIAAELEQCRRDEVKRITDKYKAELDDCEWSDWSYSYRTPTTAAAEIKAAVDKLVGELGEKWNHKMEEIKAKRDAEIAEVNAMVLQ